MDALGGTVGCCLICLLLCCYPARPPDPSRSQRVPLGARRVRGGDERVPLGLTQRAIVVQVRGLQDLKRLRTGSRASRTVPAMQTQPTTEE